MKDISIVSRLKSTGCIRQNPGDRECSHIFHHAATSMLEKGVSMPVISKVLGHTAPNSINLYLHADFIHLKACSISIEKYPYRRYTDEKPKREALEIARHIRLFLHEYAPTHLTSSGHTLKSYQTALFLFFTFLECEKGIVSTSLMPDCFSKINIEQWIEWLMKARDCTSDTANNRRASLRSFLKYFGSREPSYLHFYQEALLIPRKKGIQRKVCGLSKEAMQVLLNAPDISTKTGRRDLAFMILLYSTAARISEILDMKIGQLHLAGKKPYVNVIGKGNKIRTLYLLPKTVAHIEKYLYEFHGEPPEQKAYLFYSRNTGIYGKMSQPAVDKFFKKVFPEMLRMLSRHSVASWT